MTLRVLQIGHGYFGRLQSEAWQRIEGAELVGIVDPTDPDMLPDLASGQNLRPNIIDIATPPDTHIPLIGQAVEMAPKAIVCQKPFCGTLPIARKAVALAEAANVPLIVHENFRFQPWFRAIQGCDIGERRIFTFRLRTGDGRGAEAYLERQPYFRTMARFLVHETLVHYLDVATWLMGPVISVFATFNSSNEGVKGEDGATISMVHSGGGRSLIDGDRCGDNGAEDPRLTFGEGWLEGTEATLHLAPDGHLTRRGFGETKGETLLPRKRWEGFAGDSVFAFQSHVVRALNGEEAFQTGARDYLAVLDLEEAVYRSAAEGRVVNPE